VKLNDAVASIANMLDGIRATATIPELQVTGYYNPLPTPPSIDVYPADPFEFGAGFGLTSNRTYFVVRARVSMADSQAGSYLLLRLLDPEDTASVENALAPINCVVDNTGGISGFRRYSEDLAETLLGCEWRVGMFL